MFILDIFLTIWSTITALLPFVILLGVLVFIHELGHFAVARWCGVLVEVFSLGFGKKIFQKKKGDTTYCISLFPLGGYVKMFGHEYGKEIPKEKQSVSFLHKKVWQRSAIVLAGPLMNFFLAILLFAGLNMIAGDQKALPVIGELKSTSLAAKAGLKYGDRILSVNKIPVKNLEDFNQLVAQEPLGPLQIEVEKNTTETVQTYKLTSTTGSVKGKWGFPEPGAVIQDISFFSREAIVGVIDPDSPAGKAGFKTFDKIISLNGEKVRGWKPFELLLNIQGLLEGTQLTFEVQREKKTLEFLVNYQNKEDLKPEHLGLTHSELFIADIKEGGAADRAGLKKGDMLLKINGTIIPSWPFLVQKIQNFDNDKGPLNLDIKRNGKVFNISLVPEIKTQMIRGIEKKHYMLGIIANNPHFLAGGSYQDRNLNPIKALGVGVNRTFYWCGVVGVFIKKLIVGDISRKNLGGAIAIGREAYNSYSYGLEYFFKLMAILSVQLFLLNMLPIPIFDGGHLLFYVIEIIKGSPLSLKKIMLAHQLGFIFLLALLVFTTFNDIHNWFFAW